MNKQLFFRTCVCKSNKKTDKEMQQELESQLHEQYAINNNSNLSSVVTLFVALIAVFGGYGYVFIHSSLNFNFGEMYNKCTELYSMDALVFAAMASFIVIAFMNHICLYQGYHQRFEQFITYSIRCKYYHQQPEKLGHRIYPSNYTPFKSFEDLKKCLQFGEHGLCQGLFGEFLKIFLGMEIIIGSTLLIKIICNVCEFYDSSSVFQNASLCAGFELFALLIVILICLGYNCDYEDEQKKKYVEYMREYRILCLSACNKDNNEVDCKKGCPIMELINN